MSRALGIHKSAIGKKVTAADVARSAGVSPATVDRVLNGRGSVSVDKERRVVEQAIRLGLDRNIRLRPTRTIRIGVAMAHASNPFYESLRLAFARANRLFFASNVPGVVHFFNILALEEVARTMRQAADVADALIVVAPRHPLIEEVLEKVGRAKPSSPWSPICRGSRATPMSGWTTCRRDGWPVI